MLDYYVRPYHSELGSSDKASVGIHVSSFLPVKNALQRNRTLQ
jgi:hypothetical protein